MKNENKKNSPNFWKLAIMYKSTTFYCKSMKMLWYIYKTPKLACLIENLNIRSARSTLYAVHSAQYRVHIKDYCQGVQKGSIFLMALSTIHPLNIRSAPGLRGIKGRQQNKIVNQKFVNRKIKFPNDTAVIIFRF